MDIKEVGEVLMEISNALLNENAKDKEINELKKENYIISKLNSLMILKLMDQFTASNFNKGVDYEDMSDGIIEYVNHASPNRMFTPDDFAEVSKRVIEKMKRRCE